MASVAELPPAPGPPPCPPAAAGVRWCLQLLGRPALVETATQRRIELRPKDAALLALVALSGPIAPAQVYTRLWPDAGARQADNSLRQRLFRLRRDAGCPLVAGAALLSLSAEMQSDLAPTLARIAVDEQAGREELMGGLQFDELAELADWLRDERRAWRERRDAALAAAAAHSERAGAVARALVLAGRLVESQPLAEHPRRQQMRLHYLRGDRAAAIAVFEDLERRLKDELGTRPSAETIELLATIERSGNRLPAHRPVAPVSLIRPPRLIGREREWQLMQQAWAAGRSFVLRGEAGIGKSRLLADFAAAEGSAVSIRARAGDTGVPYAVLARLARAVLASHPLVPGAPATRDLALLLPELGTPAAVSGSAQRLLLLAALDGCLAAATDGGLAGVLVDDLHFADDASLDLMQSLIESDKLGALRWGLALRPAESGRALAQLLATLVDAQRAAACTLEPLDATELAELIDSLGLPELDAARLAPALLRHSGGNPLFALETLRDQVLGEGSAMAGARGLPQPRSVIGLIERRLAQLSPAALKLARMAALAGADFSAEAAAEVLDLHPLDIAEPWRELEAAQVIRDGAFAHDLILEAARASVPGPIAQLLHARIARHLVAQRAPPAAVAPHWDGAGQWLAAGQAWVAAANAAQGASQRTHEVAHWRCAAIAFERAQAHTLAHQSRCDSVPALIVVEGVAPARALADALVEGARSDAERASALIARAMAALMAADHGSGIEAAEQASALARRLQAPGLALHAACLHAVGLAQAGRAAEGLVIIEPLRDWVEREGTLQQRGRYWSDYAYALNAVRRLHDTAHALQCAITHAQALGDLAELATLTSNMATVRGNLGQVDEALALAQRALALQTQLGATDGPEGGVVHAYVGYYCGMVGRYGEALEHLDAAQTCFARDGQTLWTAVACNHRVQLMLELGQHARALQALNYEQPSVRSVRARGDTLAARIARASGQPAPAALDQVLAEMGPGDDVLVRMHLMLEIAAGESPATGLPLCEDVLRQAAALGFAGVALKARLRRAQLELRAARPDAAARSAREVISAMGPVRPADLYFAEAWWIAAQAFDASGDGDEALLALARGAQWVRRTALPQVPEPFRDSFLQRNPVNRALLAAADQRLAAVTRQ